MGNFFSIALGLFAALVVMVLGFGALEDWSHKDSLDELQTPFVLHGVVCNSDYRVNQIPGFSDKYIVSIKPINIITQPLLTNCDSDTLAYTTNGVDSLTGKIEVFDVLIDVQSSLAIDTTAVCVVDTSLKCIVIFDYDYGSRSREAEILNTLFERGDKVVLEVATHPSISQDSQRFVGITGRLMSEYDYK